MHCSVCHELGDAARNNADGLPSKPQSDHIAPDSLPHSDEGLPTEDVHGVFSRNKTQIFALPTLLCPPPFIQSSFADTLRCPSSLLFAGGINVRLCEDKVAVSIREAEKKKRGIVERGMEVWNGSNSETLQTSTMTMPSRGKRSRQPTIAAGFNQGCYSPTNNLIRNHPRYV